MARSAVMRPIPATVTRRLAATPFTTRGTTRTHAVDDAVEFLDDAVELAHGVVITAALPIRARLIFGVNPRHSDGGEDEPQSTRGQCQPFPSGFHRMSPFRVRRVFDRCRQAYAAGSMNVSDTKKFLDPGLVDFGANHSGGRRLELLGGVYVDRPLAQAGLPDRHQPHWNEAAVTFHPDSTPDSQGRWELAAPIPDPWRVAIPLGIDRHGAREPAVLSLEVRPAPSGQIGVFLEQIEQWRWLARVTPPAASMLSLFAHSGAATLALAAAGARVVNVDASRQATALARRNAEASGLAAAPVRWICEDARTFVAREIRRGATYDGIVLDPPSWGHGPKGQPFAIDRDLEPLLADLARLLRTNGASGRLAPVLLTCHSPHWHHRRLHDTLAALLHVDRVESGTLLCRDAAGRSLLLGDYARIAPGR